MNKYISFWVMIYIAIFGFFFLLNYRKVITVRHVLNTPKRTYQRIFMKEERARVIIKEYEKLRKFILTLDIPLKEKDYMIYSIDRDEKKLAQELSDNATNEMLKNLKEDI